MTCFLHRSFGTMPSSVKSEISEKETAAKSEPAEYAYHLGDKVYLNPAPFTETFGPLQTTEVVVTD